MFTDFIHTLMNNVYYTVSATTAILIALFLVWKRYTDDVWWTDFLVQLPLIGKMSKWKKNTTGIANMESWKHVGMPPAEEVLCSTYVDKIPKVNLDVFSNSNEYLKLTHQNDRTPLSSIMLIILAILTFAEAAGTGLLIAPFVASEITGNQMVWIGYAIALVMAIGLLGLTHAAGKDVYKYTAIRNALGDVGTEEYYKEKVTSGTDQSIDQDENHKVRFANRVLKGADDKGTLVKAIIVVVFLALLLSGITWMRIKGIQVELTQDVAEQSQSQSSPFGQQDSVDSVLNGLPDSVVKSAKDAKAQVNNELYKERLSQGVAATIVLGIIYLITQALGFFFSLNHSFMEDGRSAYDNTRGESSFQSYTSKHITPALDRGNMRLNHLRAYFRKKSDEYSTHPSKLNLSDFYHRHLKRLETNSSSISFDEAKELKTSSSPHIDSDEITKVANKILNEPDAERRKMILELSADGSLDKRKEILDAVQGIKERRKEEEELAKREEDILGDI